MVWGKCFLTRWEVNPGNVVKKPRSIALGAWIVLVFLRWRGGRSRDLIVTSSFG